MVKPSMIALALVVASCGSPGVPENYRSQAAPGAVDCTAFPEPPAPASCRNLYEDITHPALSTTGSAPLP